MPLCPGGSAAESEENMSAKLAYSAGASQHLAKPVEFLERHGPSSLIL